MQKPTRQVCIHGSFMRKCPGIVSSSCHIGACIWAWYRKSKNRNISDSDIGTRPSRDRKLTFIFKKLQNAVFPVTNRHRVQEIQGVGCTGVLPLKKSIRTSYLRTPFSIPWVYRKVPQNTRSLHWSLTQRCSTSRQKRTGCNCNTNAFMYLEISSRKDQRPAGRNASAPSPLSTSHSQTHIWTCLTSESDVKVRRNRDAKGW
jgi:hypothetical protein